MSEWKRTVYEHGGSRIYTEEDGRRNLVADTYQTEDADLIFAAKDMRDALIDIMNHYNETGEIATAIRGGEQALKKAGELI